MTSSTPQRDTLRFITCGSVDDGKSTLIGRLLHDAGAVPDEVLDRHVYQHRDEAAIEHLFLVAASLDSMIVGEAQILGQLKEAYRHAAKSGCTGFLLNKLMHKAFSVAKRVRTETRIGASAVSISYAAVELARKIFGDLKDKRVLLIGAGEMAELAAEHLVGQGVAEAVERAAFDRGGPGGGGGGSGVGHRMSPWVAAKIGTAITS